MAAFVPEMSRLLHAAADYLEQELLPTLEGYHRFQVRVCVNVLRIAQRQAEQERAMDAAEWSRLSALLGSNDPLPVLNEDLMQRLEDGTLALDANGLMAHMQATLHDALKIDNPAWVQTP